LRVTFLFFRGFDRPGRTSVGVLVANAQAYVAMISGFVVADWLALASTKSIKERQSVIGVSDLS